MRPLATVAAVLVTLGAHCIAAQADDPIVGVWVENISQSHYDTGAPPINRVWSVEKTPDGRFRMVMDSVGADGRRTRLEAVVALDGRDYPVEGSSLPLTQAYTRVDARTIEETVRVNGQTMLTALISVSADGKIRTLRENRYLSNRGEQMERVTHSVLVAERSE